jgi:hypothetical protein
MATNAVETSVRCGWIDQIFSLGLWRTVTCVTRAAAIRPLSKEIQANSPRCSLGRNLRGSGTRRRIWCPVCALPAGRIERRS